MIGAHPIGGAAELGGRLTFRDLALVAIGASSISGHVSAGLVRFGPLALVPVLAFGVSVAASVLVLSAREPVGRGARFLLVGIIVAAPGFLFAAQTEYATDKVGSLVQLTLPLVLMAALIVRRVEDLELFWRGVVGFGVVGLLAAVLDVVAGVDIGLRGSANEGLLNPIAAGRLAALVILFILFGGFRRAPLAVRSALVAGGAVVLLGAASRGPLLAMIVALVVGGFRFRAVRGRLALVALVVAVALIAGLGDALLDESGDRLLEVEEGEDASRLNLWAEALGGIALHPQGLGWGQFGAAGGIDSAADYPHNLVLEVALEAGSAAGLGLVLALLAAGSAIWRSASGAAPRHFALLAFWVTTAMFSSDVNGNRVLLIATFAMLGAYGSRAPSFDDEQLYPRTTLELEGAPQ